MSEYVRFIQRIGLVGLTNILISLSSLIFIPIITKSFTTAEYGMWAQVNTTIALVPNIANLGLPYTMVRFLSAEKDKEKIKDSFYPMISLTFISTLIICSLFLIFGNTIANADNMFIVPNLWKHNCKCIIQWKHASIVHYNCNLILCMHEPYANKLL